MECFATWHGIEVLAWGSRCICTQPTDATFLACVGALYLKAHQGKDVSLFDPVHLCEVDHGAFELHLVAR